jgi:hypothetical protein
MGKTLTLDGHPFPILGVTPPSFYGVAVGNRFDVAVPICAEPIIAGDYSPVNSTDRREDWWLSVFGRLKPRPFAARALSSRSSRLRPPMKRFRRNATPMASSIISTTSGAYSIRGVP